VYGGRLVVDVTELFWAERGRIKSLPTRGGTPKLLAQLEESVHALALSGSTLYVAAASRATPSENAILKLPKAGGAMAKVVDFPRQFGRLGPTLLILKDTAVVTSLDAVESISMASNKIESVACCQAGAAGSLPMKKIRSATCTGSRQGEPFFARSAAVEGQCTLP
jgi:hypothetical protein